MVANFQVQVSDIENSVACLEVMTRADKDQIIAGAIENNQKML